MTGPQPAPTTSGAGSTTALFERLGGSEGIARLIDAFYDRVVADPELAPFFTHTPMDRLRQMQREFFGAVLGGHQRYSGPGLTQVHEGRGITAAHYNRFAQHLVASLTDLGVPRGDIDAVLERLALHAGDILGQTNEAG